VFGFIDGISFPWDGLICCKPADPHEHAFYISDVADSIYNDRSTLRSHAIRAYFGAAMLEEQTVLGTICGVSAQPRPWVEGTDEAQIERCIRTIASLVSYQMRIERSMMIADHERQRALIDPLTGIANRLGWEDYANAIEPLLHELEHRAAVAFIDLDELKIVNDRRGHDSGDALLKQAVSALRQQLKPNDFIARIGGDEFAILFMDYTDPQYSSTALDLEQALRQDGIRASIGIARVQETGGLRLALALADKRMYESKLANAKPSSGL